MTLFVIPLVAIAGSFLLLAMWATLAYRHAKRRQELWHETARVALQNGQPLPPLPQLEKRDEPATDIRTGLILIAAAGGIYTAFAAFVQPLKFVAAIPGFIGIALILNALLGVWLRKPANAAPPPGP